MNSLVRFASLGFKALFLKWWWTFLKTKIAFFAIVAIGWKGLLEFCKVQIYMRVTFHFRISSFRGWKRALMVSVTFEFLKLCCHSDVSFSRCCCSYMLLISRFKISNCTAHLAGLRHFSLYDLIPYLRQLQKGHLSTHHTCFLPPAGRLAKFWKSKFHLKNLTRLTLEIRSIIW